MLVLQIVSPVPLVQSDPAVLALDPDVPLVVPVRLLGQEATSSSIFARA